MENIMDHGPILVGGVSRCGKTLICALLSSHPNIAISTKGSNLWTYFYRRYGDLSQHDNFERCLGAMLRYTHVLNLKPDPDRIRKEFWQGEPTYTRLFALLNIHYARQLGKPRWGAQSGFLECYADPIFAAYPTARMVHMIRDPRDRYAEAITKWPQDGEKVGEGTATWLYSVGLAKRNRKRYPNRYKIVRYETLVSQPQKTMRDICAFLGEDYTHRILAMGNAPGIQDADGSGPDGKNGRGNVSTAFIGRFRQVMSKREIAFMQAYARRGMIAHGYELEPVELSTGDRLLFHFMEQPVNLVRLIGWLIGKAFQLGFPAQMGCNPSPDKLKSVGLAL